MQTHILTIVVALSLCACGGRIDKDRETPVVIANNTTSNNTTSSNNVSTNVSANNTTANNTTSNNTTANNTTSNNTTPNNGIDPVVASRCANYCEAFAGACVIGDCRLGPNGERDRSEAYEACVGDGDPSLACTTIYTTNPDFKREVDGFDDNSCNIAAARDLRCEVYSTTCGACPAPVLGTACTVDGDCDAAELTPLCFEEQPDGRFPGGQCLAGGCETPADATEGQLFSGGATGCGVDGACFVGPGLNTFCLATCTQNSDCHRAVTGATDTGYACNIIGTTELGGPLRALGFCEGACVDDSDCAAASPVCGATRSCRADCVSDADCPSSLACTGMSANGQRYCEL